MAKADYRIHIFKGRDEIYYEDEVDEDFIYSIVRRQYNCRETCEILDCKPKQATDEELTLQASGALGVLLDENKRRGNFLGKMTAVGLPLDYQLYMEAKEYIKTYEGNRR